ncbi:hypothetical protein ILUMI_27326 [Ignelater luminosus]|uniref:CHK kinase-like domain-containing protein n=1 Tax=Ignelater luminosus TaxID=2038154 RepID=A0A8K0C539_IGNLU|nr:hypothetical protein ILUMI_27326 [Ignelater luminosus]
MEDTTKIPELEQLLQPFLKDNLKIVQYTTKRLTAAGENYGSLMLQTEIKLKSNTDPTTEKTLNLVAKLTPSNEFIKKFFRTAITFKKEMEFYTTIAPILKSIQIEQGVSEIIDCLPECYGARISLDSKSNVVDDGAIVLLENLKLKEFDIMDRFTGLDFETTKLLVKDLAVFHAVVIGVKLLKPDVFKNKILPHLGPVCMFEGLSKEAQQQIVDGIIDIAGANHECVPLLPKVKKSLLESWENMKNPPEPREPFATITHNDFWVNNAMIKLEGNKPIKCKIVDFQLIEYGSPADDLIFFLFSSVRKEVLDLHYDNLIKLYYEVFIKTLKDLKCDISPFTYASFEKEINTSAKMFQFLHIMIMLRPIFTPKKAATEVDNLSEQELLKDETISDEYRQKVPEMILHFAKRGWI